MKEDNWPLLAMLILATIWALVQTARLIVLSFSDHSQIPYAVILVVVWALTGCFIWKGSRV